MLGIVHLIFHCFFKIDSRDGTGYGVRNCADIPRVFLELRMLKEGRGQKRFWSEAGFPGIFRRGLPDGYCQGRITMARIFDNLWITHR